MRFVELVGFGWLLAIIAYGVVRVKGTRRPEEYLFRNRVKKSLIFARRALLMVHWMPVHDPDTHEVLGQLCYWCNRKPHAPNCRRQQALELIGRVMGELE
ncbi:hypothetical protein ES705_35251 [subsurface metagenome]